MVRGDPNTDGPGQFSYSITFFRVAGNVQAPFGLLVPGETILSIVGPHRGAEEPSPVDPFDKRHRRGRLTRMPLQHRFFARIRPFCSERRQSIP